MVHYLVRWMNTGMQNEELIKACKKGDRIAQKRLYDLYAPQMMGICMRYARNTPEAEDILQEAFIKVFTHINQYRSEGEPGAWIRRIVVNCAINMLKKQRLLSSSWDEQQSEEHPLADHPPEVILEAKELTALIQRLPDGYRMVFNLYAIEGYTHEEISGMLGIKPVSSRSQYMRARTLLAKAINTLQQEIKKSSHG